MKQFPSGIALLLCVSLLDARQEKVICGTTAETWREESHLHRQSERRGIRRVRKASALRMAGETQVGRSLVRADVGQVAVIDDTDGVIARRNPFNLSSKTLQFLPAGNTLKYRFRLGEGTYEAPTADAGTAIAGLGDDDTRELALPFPFPFWGQTYSSLFVNSDGNLTFNGGDSALASRSLGRLTSGLPRIAPLFVDLDPTRAPESVRVTSNANRFVVSWAATPLYADNGRGAEQTFQVRLYPDGKIEVAYAEIRVQDTVVGITPGALKGATSIVSFAGDTSAEYTSTIAERFAGSEDIDIYAAAQKFYLNHDDSYDYLVFYNTLGINAGESAVANEITVRNNRGGIGDLKVERGLEAGSKRRLQALVNMGHLSQYPKDTSSPVPGRLGTGDTPLTTIAHEAGHLFSAYASVRDENDADARPMLGYQNAHWSFVFNSEASLLEGNRIRDDGPSASPRFTTVAATEAYSALDQYLMGLHPAESVPDMFLVRNPRGTATIRTPQVGVAFDGQRRDIRIEEIVQAEGRRIPDHTVSQRRFRFAFIVIVANGTEPSEADLAQVDTYRREFEAFFHKASSNKAFADTSLKRSLHVSVFPAAGVIEGSSGTATIALENPAVTPLTVILKSESGAVQMPASVVIPAGQTQASFTIRGARQGTDDLIAEPADWQFETVHSRVQVSAASALTVSVSAGDFQTASPGKPLARPISFRVLDRNELPYPGITVQATPSGGGSVDRASGVTDETGTVSFIWTPGTANLNELRASLPTGAAIIATALSRPAFAATSVVNAASFAAGLTPGGIATIFGANLADARSAQVLVNGRPAQVFYSSPRQVNFLVPVNASEGMADLSVRTATGISEVTRVPVAPLQPGIFFDTASGFGAILVAGTGQVTQQRPAAAGEVIEIYATGLGLTQIAAASPLTETAVRPEVTIGGRPAQLLFSGLAPGFSGLYQVNVQVPAGLAAGPQTLRMSTGAAASNEVKLQIR